MLKDEIGAVLKRARPACLLQGKDALAFEELLGKYEYDLVKLLNELVGKETFSKEEKEQIRVGVIQVKIEEEEETKEDWQVVVVKRSSSSFPSKRKENKEEKLLFVFHLNAMIERIAKSITCLFNDFLLVPLDVSFFTPNVFDEIGKDRKKKLEQIILDLNLKLIQEEEEVNNKTKRNNEIILVDSLSFEILVPFIGKKKRFHIIVFINNYSGYLLDYPFLYSVESKEKNFIDRYYDEICLISISTTNNNKEEEKNFLFSFSIPLVILKEEKFEKLFKTFEEERRKKNFAIKVR